MLSKNGITAQAELGVGHVDRASLLGFGGHHVDLLRGPRHFQRVFSGSFSPFFGTPQDSQGTMESWWPVARGARRPPGGGVLRPGHRGQ